MHPSLRRGGPPQPLRRIQSSDCGSLFTAGYRDRTGTGALGGVGTSGYAWSSSSYASGNINAGNLGFNATVVNPLNNNNRANGFPVRCVQASAKAVFYPFFRPPGQTGHDRNNSVDPEWPGLRLRPERSQIPQSAGDRPCRCQLCIPVCAGATPKVSSAAFIPAIVSGACYGLPQQHDGSHGERRHVGRLLLFVASAFGQYQREPSGLWLGRSETSEQCEPGERPFRALRPQHLRGAVSIVSATGRCGCRKRIPRPGVAEVKASASEVADSAIR